MHRFIRSICLATAVLSTCALHAEDWPQFRGPNCSGISTTTATLPVEFSETEHVLWSDEIGEGVGSPVIAAGRLFVTAMVDKETVGLLAFDAKTGKPIWKQTWKTGPLAEVHETNSHASTTPAADADHVYVYFPTMGMLAFDAATGAQLWEKKLPVPFFVFKWGPAMSPVLYKDLVIFCQDDDLAPAIYALNKETGEIVWMDDRSDMAVNYSHPVICETDQGEELVVAGTGKLIGYDPNNGERLWYAKVLLRNIKTTPVCQDGTIYISLQSGGIANQWLATADQAETGNSDGKLTREEMQGFVGETKIPESFFKKTFERGDKNKDGFLEGEELDFAFLHPDNFAGARFDAEEAGDQFVLAVRGGGRGDVTDSHVLWKHKTKYTDHIVSPFVHDGRMFLIKGGGITTVFDTEEGKVLRRAKRISNTSEYFASPIYGDGKIYLAGENGFVVVLADDPDYEILAKNDMGDSIVGTPAIADGRLYIRTRTKLICVGEE
ncbi:outer membrane biogenesis protein BamB [Symmachiella dynata]|uniref:Outer membrane biogenesis protein BamB n=1 Tax=Symmachiella dynata TaxID=2527995 RepID=A0A517ZTJ5_9PLAN|nr:PQQ-binding-like beta-propeller repeat protein [Symmachiella dynata]QDU45789.1 outer membrane biogenesis protein BamB [Symmachiella dynata]